MARLSLTLFGGFRARVASRPVSIPLRKAQALLAYLALPLGELHSREQLVTLLWGDTGEEQARNSLRQTLFGVRKVLSATKSPCLRIAGETVSLEASAVDVDVAAFERLAAEDTNEALAQATALYQGDLLEGLTLRETAFEDWLMWQRGRLRQAATEVLTKLLTRQFEAGEMDQTIHTGLRLMDLDPLQESVHRILMRCYARQGRRTSALRQYKVCVDVLQRELRTEPEPATTQVYREIVREARDSGRTPDAPMDRPTQGPFRPPIIGRESEMARLEEQLSLASAGRGRVIAILGEAEVGKTRLAEELVVDAVRQGCLVLKGRSYETSRILPFGLWVDALRGEAISRAEALHEMNPAWWRELAQLFPEIPKPRTRGVLSTDALRIFEALAQLTHHLSARQPLLLVLEDLHWADDMSLRLLSVLGRRLQDWSVLLVVTARIEDLDQTLLAVTLAELGAERSFLQLTLGPLSRAGTMTLVRALVPSAIQGPELSQIVEHAWRMSEGNPFVIAETIRTLQDGKALPATEELPLPDRVRDMTLSRLQRLSGRAQKLVAVAAVIGREFDFSLLQRTADLDAREAAEGVEELVRRHVLREIDDHFDFTHDRIREAAYRALLQPRRQLLHGAVARALEELNRESLEPHYAALAVHNREAHIWEKAVIFLRAAGAQAAARGAYREAVAVFEQALTALTRLPRRADTIEQAIDIRFDLRDWLMPLGELSRLREYLDEAAALATQLGDDRRIGLASGHLAHYFWLVGEPDRAMECAQRTADLAAALTDFTLEVLGNFYLGEAYNAIGDYPRSVRFLARNVELTKGEVVLERFAGPGLVPLQSRFWLALSLAQLGELSTAIAIAEDGHRAAEAVEHPYSLAFAKNTIAQLHLARGALEPAIAALEQCRAAVESRQIALNRPGVMSLLGYAYALSGRASEGLPLLELAVEQAAAMRRSGRAMMVSRLAETYLMTGRSAAALVSARHALELAREQKERGNEGWTVRLLGEIFARQEVPNLEEAVRHYRGAITLAETLRMRPLVAHCHLGLGRLYRRAGPLIRAEEHLMAAVRMFREMDMPIWAEHAEEAMKPAGLT